MAPTPAVGAEWQAGRRVEAARPAFCTSGEAESGSRRFVDKQFAGAANAIHLKAQKGEALITDLHPMLRILQNGLKAAGWELVHTPIPNLESVSMGDFAPLRPL